MKLIIQIPCFNEAGTLAETVADLPTAIPGIDVIEYLIIDDGSTDGTREVAEQLGIHHIIENRANLGLARSFARGLDYALGAGADIIVNTDGDNQYHGADIALLVAPIVEGRADLVIGDRQTSKVAHFSPFKKFMQRFGSAVVRRFSGVVIPDAVSGFRAIDREAAMQINIVSSFSYTIEMLIQAGKKGMCVASVPVRTNPKTRESRLFKSVFQFMERSGTTAIRMYAMYQPLRTFSVIGLLIAFIGIIPIVRFVYFYFFVTGEGRIQSLVIGSALMTAGTITFVIGLMADLVGRNRQLLELTLERVRKIEFELRTQRQELSGAKDEPVHEELDRRGNPENDEQHERIPERR